MAFPEPDPPLEPIALAEAAERLGVHYMTAYRYVRTGRLQAERDGGRWLVDPASLTAMLDGTGASPPKRRRGTAPAARRRELERSLVRGDEAAVWRQLEDLLAGGLEPERLYLEVLIPVMRSIGDAWETGELSVGAEHRASTVMVRAVGRLGPLFAAPGRKRGAIVLGAPAGDRHSLPVTMLADPLRGRRFEVIDLGADAPADSFVEAAAGADRLVGVGVCATTASRRSIAATVDALHDAIAGVHVVLGGTAVADQPTATRLHADTYSASAPDALTAFDALAPS